MPTVDFIDRLKNITLIEWFKLQSASWSSGKTVKFAQTLFSFGLCFTFNPEKFDDVFRRSE